MRTTSARTRSVIVVVAIIAAACSGAATQSSSASAATSRTPTVGPPHGSVIVVGGGGQGPEVFAKFIELAGGPDALILDVPTAGGDTAYPPTWRGQNGLKAAGAKNVFVLHTSNRKVADADSFVAPIKRAGGIWFEGGRHFRLVDSYLGTKTEYEFNQVLARGGVAAGSSAGASILGSFLVRGAPSNNNAIMAHPGYLKGFAYLRGVGIDQHVVARERLADLADSLMRKYPDTLFISEDEGTAWVVRGDIAEIIGRNKAFVYNGRDKTDPGKPYLALHPGDKYDLAGRRVIHRAVDESPLTQKFVDQVFAEFAKPGAPQATVVVAQDGKVFINSAYNVPPQRKFMSETTMPNFPLGGLSDGLNATMALDAVIAKTLKLDDQLTNGATVGEFLAHQKEVPNGNKQLAALIAKGGGGSFAQTATRRIMTPVGMHKTVVDSTTGLWMSNVDELYRWELALSRVRPTTDAGEVNLAHGFGWRIEQYNGLTRHSQYGTPNGMRNAYVRIPEKRAAIIILTNSDNVNAKLLADKIAYKLFPPK